MGSDSDPSGDNLDEEEVYRDVYGVSNPGRLIEQKKQREQEFIEKVQTDAGATQADMLNQLLNREGTPDLRALNDQSLDAELLGGDDDAPRWEPMPSMHEQRVYSACAAVAGSIIVAGGLGRKSAEVYDEVLDRWFRLPHDFPVDGIEQLAYAGSALM